MKFFFSLAVPVTRIMWSTEQHNFLSAWNVGKYQIQAVSKFSESTAIWISLGDNAVDKDI